MKAPHLLLSHLALGLAGWGIAMALKPVPEPEPQALKSKSDRAAVASSESDELVRRIRADLAKQAAAKAKELPPEQMLREKLLRRLSSIAAPSDPAAAFRAALEMAKDEDSELTAVALFIHWTVADPAAALAYAESNPMFGDLNRDFRDLALEIAGERLEPEVVLPLVETGEILRGVARTLVSQKSPQGLAELVPQLSERLQGNLKVHLVEQWPAGRLDDFGRFVTAMDDPEMIPFGSDQWSRKDLSVWLLRFVETHPDRDFARRVQDTTTFTCLLRDNPDLPLKERIGNFRPGDAMAFFATHDVGGFFNSDDGPDLLHAFHHGRIEAPEILKLLSARFPDYGAAGLLPERAHEILCGEDPARAAVLLDDLPEKERSRVMAQNFGKRFSYAPLDTIEEALRVLPQSTDDELAGLRANLLRDHVKHAIDTYGPDYLRWIEALPEPSDRTLALRAIAWRIESSQEWYAKEIREVIGDTQLPDPD